TNAQKVYDLDEDVCALLELFNCYKIETVYEANVVNEDGEWETMRFDSEDDYKKYISPYCGEEEVERMVENFLRKRDKKIHYDPLCTIGF
nr:hypothetical protein [Helicobacteraceae bacterium]